MDRISFVVRNKIHMTLIDAKLMGRIVMRGNYKKKQKKNWPILVLFCFLRSYMFVDFRKKKQKKQTNYFASARSHFKCVFSFVLKRFKAPASTLCCVYVFAAPAAPII